jgi:septum formation protein
MTLILASQSASRRAMLEAAGVPFEAVRAGVDEEAAKIGLLAAGIDGRNLADALAEMKALKVSVREPGALVLGCDSVVQLADGSMLDKPETRDQAGEHLRRLSNGIHSLYSAAVIAENGQPVWRHVDRAKLHVRPLSEAFVETYLDVEWPAIAGCVGCFRIEGPGVQLFNRIEGDHFTVLGLPLMNVLGFLRTRGYLAS